jgi:hypothetical protein
MNDDARNHEREDTLYCKVSTRTQTFICLALQALPVSSEKKSRLLSLVLLFLCALLLTAVCLLCVLLLSYVYFCYLMCIVLLCVLLSYILQLPDCWLEVSIRKVLQPATSTQVFFGFPVSKSECWDGSQDAKLLLHISISYILISYLCTRIITTATGRQSICSYIYYYYYYYY